MRSIDLLREKIYRLRYTFATKMSAALFWQMNVEKGERFSGDNDFVMTRPGGVTVGETLFRFSGQILDDRAGGRSASFGRLAARSSTRSADSIGSSAAIGCGDWNR